ncbi:MAG: FAD-binding oxidoreductase, partial [bacterium]|nr:FAD-binding oxidoreductase [bacterium]
MKSIAHRGFLEPSPVPGVMALEAQLKKILRKDQISPLWADRLSYGRDCNSKAFLWARSGKVRYPPHWVVWPENSQEVSKILQLASEQKIPVVPFGGGSGVCGGTWALRGGICLDLKRMDAILDLDTRKMQARVQAGMNGELFERALNRRGLTLGHFPSSIYAATIGGYLACRSAGQFSSLYGKIEDMVEGLEVVLSDGQILQLENVRERPQSLDLKEVFLGSEGTLGVMTEGSFRVHPIPQMEVYRGFFFSNVGKGLEAAREIMQRGLKPSVLRLYDPLDTLLTSSHDKKKDGDFWLNPLVHWLKDQSLKPLLKNPRFLKNLTDFLPSRCLMILGFQGLEAFVPGKLTRAQAICKKFHGKDLG